MGLVKTGWVASIPYAFGVVGSVGGGWVADRLMARGLWPKINSRKVPVIVGLVGMGIFTYVAAVVASDTAAVACIAGAVFCAGCSSGMSWALASVVAPESCTASLGQPYMNFGGYLGGALAPHGDRLHRPGDGQLRAGTGVGLGCGAGRRPRLPADRPRPRDRVGRAGPGRPRGRRLTPDFSFDLDRG